MMNRPRRAVLLALMLGASSVCAEEFRVYTGEGEFLPGRFGSATSKALDVPEVQWEPGALDAKSWDRDARAARPEDLKLSPMLRATMAAAGSTRRSKALDAVEERIEVQIRAAESVAQTRSVIEDHGGVVAAELESVVYAELPIEAVGKLSRHDAVAFVSESRQYRESARLPSSGADLMEVRLLHRAGFTGAGVRIGLIDLGFQQYSRLEAAGLVPTPLASAEFISASRSRRGIEQKSPHGTACAEIVHRVAPQADVLLARFDGRDSTLVRAVQWLVEQKVDIISASFGATVKPLDGRDVIDRMVDATTRKHGVLFVVAAGNEARNIWSGPVADRNRNSLVDVGADRQRKDLLAVTGSGGPWTLAVHWDDWGRDPSLPTSTQDIDAYLVDVGRNGKPRILAASTNPQNGRQQPVEVFRGDTWPKGRVAYLALRIRNVTRELKVHVVPVSGLKITPTESASTINSPATAVSALAVGAVDVNTGRLADYSSRGPTADGRVKPDLVAPAGLRSEALRQQGGIFHGTSAAAPHVAAFAALLKQGNPSLRGASLKSATMEVVKAMSGPVPNNAYGFGLPQGSLALAQVTSLKPPPNTRPPLKVRPDANPAQDQIQRTIEELLRAQQRDGEPDS